MLDKKAFSVYSGFTVSYLNRNLLQIMMNCSLALTYSITAELSAQLNLSSEYLQWSIFLYYYNQQGYQ